MDLNDEQQKINELKIMADYEGEDKIITSHEAWNSTNEIRKRETRKFFSKIPSLDFMLDGFREGDVIVISGITKNGKTTLAQNLTNNLASQNINCLWFSYELTLVEFLSKFKPELPFFTLPAKLNGNSLEWLDTKICESIAKYGTKVIFIDHLHFLLDMSYLGQRGNISLIIGGIMRELKKIAIRREVAIVIIAHTTKTKAENEPDYSDIRDSSFISQEADTVLMIWRKKKGGELTENEAILAVMLNRRNGKCGKIKLLLKNGYFEEITDIYASE